jgi:hypothetical protein
VQRKGEIRMIVHFDAGFADGGREPLVAGRNEG